jgi:hypothetical protein
LKTNFLQSTAPSQAHLQGTQSRHTKPNLAKEPALCQRTGNTLRGTQTHIIDDRGERANVQHGVWQKWGGRNNNELFVILWGFCSSLTEFYLAFCCYLHHQFFNQQRFRADGILFPHLRQALPVSGHCKATPYKY